MRQFLVLSVSTLAVSALGLASPALAADAGDTIVVTATRTEAPLSQVGQSVSVVTREDIERQQSVSAVDVLSRLPGVSTAASGGFGQPASVFIRGADNAQSLVLIDGVRINDPGDVGGGFDFGSLAIGQFERVEVVRGAQGVLWGSRAIGGVVNFITAEPSDQWTGRVQGEYGAYDTRQIGASASGKVGPLGLSFGANSLSSDGYSAFSEKLGGTERDGYESKSANARVAIDLVSGLSVDAGGFYSKSEYDYDDFGADALHTGSKRDGTVFANLRYAGLDDRLSGRIGYGLTDTRRISNHALFGPYITDGRNERFEGQAAFTPVEIVTLLVGGEMETSRFKDNYGSRDRATIDSGFASLTLRPVQGLMVNGGLRYDDHSDYGNDTTFSANAAWSPAGEGGPILRASYGEGFKAPSLYQLYTNATYLAFTPGADPADFALEAETSKGWDAGIEQPFADGHGTASITYFDRKTRNQIDFDFATFTYYNIGKARAKGLELGLALADWKGFDIALAYTYLDAEDALTGNRLARRPKHNLSASLDYRWAFGLSTEADMRVGGARYDDQANSQRVGGHTVFGLRASYPLTEQFEVYGRVENLFDETYEVVRTYGTAGRSAYLGVRARF